MIGVYKHKKTGDLYLVVRVFKLKIPLIGYWVSFTAYRSYYGLEYVTYIRLTCLFNMAFVKITNSKDCIR